MKVYCFKVSYCTHSIVHERIFSSFEEVTQFVAPLLESSREILDILIEPIGRNRAYRMGIRERESGGRT